MKVIIPLLVFTIIINSCSNKNNNSKIAKLPDVKIDSKALKTIENANSFADLFSLKQIINLETTNESLIGQIESIIYLPNEKKIIIMDSQNAKSVFVFNTDGKFLYRIGKSGEGPGEYKVPRAITYENNKLIIYDESLRLLFYNIDGTFINEINLPGKNYHFDVSKMLLFNNDLYVYDNNKFSNEGPDGKRHKVFRMLNCLDFDMGYGEYEETYNYWAGDIIVFNQRVVYSGIFDGNIYQILPGNNSSIILTSLGTLTDLSSFHEGDDALEKIIKNEKNMDSIILLGTIENMLFVRKQRMITIIDNSGKILRSNLPCKVKIPNGFEGTAARLAFLFYNNGIILVSNPKYSKASIDIPNPSLIFYEFKKI